MLTDAELPPSPSMPPRWATNLSVRLLFTSLLALIRAHPSEVDGRACFADRGNREAVRRDLAEKTTLGTYPRHPRILPEAINEPGTVSR
jgi:hypothetical protein